MPHVNAADVAEKKRDVTIDKIVRANHIREGFYYVFAIASLIGVAFALRESKTSRQAILGIFSPGYFFARSLKEAQRIARETNRLDLSKIGEFPPIDELRRDFAREAASDFRDRRNPQSSGVPTRPDPFDGHWPAKHNQDVFSASAEGTYQLNEDDDSPAELASFSVCPSTAAVGRIVTLRLFLKQPATRTVEVAINAESKTSGVVLKPAPKSVIFKKGDFVAAFSTNLEKQTDQSGPSQIVFWAQVAGAEALMAKLDIC
jgi:hypothetical protein